MKNKKIENFKDKTQLKQQFANVYKSLFFFTYIFFTSLTKKETKKRIII